MPRLLPVMAIGFLSLCTSCVSEKDAALQTSELIQPQPSGDLWVNKLGLEEMKRDCGFVESPADDPVRQTDDPSMVVVTQGYLSKLMTVCAR